MHLFSDFEAVVDEYLSQYQNSDSQDMVRTPHPTSLHFAPTRGQVIVEADTERSTALVLRRVKQHSTELALLRALNADDIRADPWNPAPRLLYTARRGTDDAVLCLERLFDCSEAPFQTIANVVDYIRQSLEVRYPLSRTSPN